MRSALSMLVSAGLVARAGVSAHQSAVGLAGGAVSVAVAIVTWRHAEMSARQAQLRAPTQAPPFRFLAAATLLIAAVSLVVAVAL
jgi:hypothetical protein